MTENTQKKTAPMPTTAIVEEQSTVKNNNNIIHENSTNSNDLSTISMVELFDNIYPPKVPIAENFLYEGTNFL